MVPEYYLSYAFAFGLIFACIGGFCIDFVFKICNKNKNKID